MLGRPKRLDSWLIGRGTLRSTPPNEGVISTGDVDDTPVDGQTGVPVSSNWAYDHIAAADPHTGYVLESLFNAHTVIYATSDNTPAALTVDEQRLVGRLTSGNISAVNIGIADNNIVQIDAADVADNEYARFTASGLESRTAAEVLSDIGAAVVTDCMLWAIVFGG